MLKDAIYGGVNAAVLTAMNADLSIDLDRMAAHSKWLLANGCNGLGVLGTTGEANSLGVSERIAVLEGLVARGIPGQPRLPDAIPPAAAQVPRSRQAWFPGQGWIETKVLDRAGLTSTTVPGPLIIQEYDATCLVPPNATASLDAFGNICLRLG